MKILCAELCPNWLRKNKAWTDIYVIKWSVIVTEPILAKRTFLGGFIKVQKVSISLIVCVRPYICMEQLGFHWVVFHAFLVFFKNLSRKLKFHWNWTRIMDIVHEDQYKFFVISCSFLLRNIFVLDLCGRENWNTHFMFNNLF
jgi:hypothetical protein